MTTYRPNHYSAYTFISDGYSPEAHNTTHQENSKEHLCANTKLARKAENTIVEMGPTAANDTITKRYAMGSKIRARSILHKLCAKAIKLNTVVIIPS